MKSRAFLVTTGDGRPTANVFWMGAHQLIIPKVEAILRELGLEPVWLHPTTEAVDSVYMARAIGQRINAEHQPGDVLINLTTGWNFPEHFGVIATMLQDKIGPGKLKLILVCNMAEKAPGYVAQRANVLGLEILELPYIALTVLRQDETQWTEFKEALGMALAGSLVQERPRITVATTSETDRIAREAIGLIRHSGGISPIIGHCASMTMTQGWPQMYLAKQLGLTPIPIGSNEFRADMAKVSLRKILGWYDELKQRGLRLVYTDGGLCEEEIFQGLRMYGAMLAYHQQGALGILSQGQMEWTRNDVADDLPLSLLMSSNCLDHEAPILAITEADWEAYYTSALMSAIIEVKYGQRSPIGFHDIRHYNVDEDTLVLLNSGALALDFMTDTPGDWSDIKAVSQNRQVYFLHGGACIMGNMRPCQNASLFRVHGQGNSYRMQAVHMNILPLTWEERAAKYGGLDDWPMGICRMPNGTTKPVTLAWIPNHGQHCEQDIVAEMQSACRQLGVDFHCYA